VVKCARCKYDSGEMMRQMSLLDYPVAMKQVRDWNQLLCQQGRCRARLGEFKLTQRFWPGGRNTGYLVDRDDALTFKFDFKFEKNVPTSAKKQF